MACDTIKRLLKHGYILAGRGRGCLGDHTGITTRAPLVRVGLVVVYAGTMQDDTKSCHII